MPKQAISVTLAKENLLWLRGQTKRAGSRSVSEVLDHLISEARTKGNVRAASIRSVRGSIAISREDPLLLRADEAVRALFHAQVSGESASRSPRGRSREVGAARDGGSSRR